MPRIRILGQHTLRLCRQRVEPAPHVRHARRQPNTRITRYRDHAAKPCTRPRTDASVVGPSTRMRRPSDRVMSTRCAETAGPRPAPALCDGAAAHFIGGAPTSTGRKTPSSAVPSGAGTLPDGANRGSFSHLKIRFAFIEYRRATCATETPGVSVCSQIERFSSSHQTRFFRPFFPATAHLKMSTIDGGHYHPLHRPGRAVRPDGYP